ncbi:MAG: aminoacetone oxidase family FAD-binding enzyme [Oscillospiraceae bacterium]|nr:aminoacetone oxidase family FAD-binding enzyme [Oscillospiraceae bacterium]
MENNYSDIIIIGGGASGMAAAIAAARKGAKVAIIERQARVGKKLLSTGNGRCNLLNTGDYRGRIHGESPEFADYALNTYPPEYILSFFEELGLVYEEEYGGRVYPFSNHASSVLDVLRAELDALSVELITGSEVSSAVREKSFFRLSCGDEIYRSEKLIIACGGCAGSKVGGVSLGYELLKGLGHSKTGLFPALAGVKTDSEYPRSLKGIRVTAGCSLRDEKGRAIKQSEGDVIFSEDGLSGTAVFDIARFVPAGKPSYISLDFLPLLSEERVRSALTAFSSNHPDYEASSVFTGALHGRVGTVLCKAAGLKPSAPMASLKERDIKALSSCAKKTDFKIKGLCGFDTAQVTAGGIRTSEFESETMESKITPGLYACGEVLDIDGDCGGFNLRWAWAGGFLAGESAACSLK